MIVFIYVFNLYPVTQCPQQLHLQLRELRRHHPEIRWNRGRQDLESGGATALGKLNRHGHSVTHKENSGWNCGNELEVWKCCWKFG